MTKIALIHGWGYNNYTKNCGGKTDAWRDRRAMVDALENKYEIKYITLPGFCGAPEPANPWTLDDFTTFINAQIKDFGPDFILGYSFGGAVALNYKLKYDPAQKLILVSPALARRYRAPSPVRDAMSAAIPKFAKNLLRDFYLSRIVRNPYYAQGSDFLKKSYLNIVDIDLSDRICDVNLDDICIIFGQNDTATPPQLFLDKAPCATPATHILQNGTHDIANTNTTELISVISDFVSGRIK